MLASQFERAKFLVEPRRRGRPPETREKHARGAHDIISRAQLVVMALRDNWIASTRRPIDLSGG